MDHRIKDLARLAGTTVRNIRAYQERGLLPPPRRQGRVAWYADAHLARLRMIAALLERGYSLANIAEMIGAWERGSELGDVLGLEDAITRPFGDEEATPISPAELIDMFGTADPLMLAKAIEIGLLAIDGAGIRVPSMRTLRAGAELVNAGIPRAALLEELARLRVDCDRMASRLVDLVGTELLDRHDRPRERAQVAEIVRRIRPLAHAVVTTQLSLALERHIRVHIGERLGRLLERKRR